jgi:hypothetical protein
LALSRILWFFGPVVPSASGGRYFQNPLKIPDSDHSSIAKPHDRNSIQHRALVDFLLDHQPTSAPRPIEESSDVPYYMYEQFPVVSGTFLGRDRELGILKSATMGCRANVITIEAMGGTGKTALLKRLLDELRGDRWKPFQGVFCWSFDSQGNSDEGHKAVDRFFARAFEHLDSTIEIPNSAHRRASKLAELFSKKKYLLVLDGVEPLQFTLEINGGQFREKSIGHLIRALAEHNDGTCIVTSRQPIFEIRDVSHGVEALKLGPLTDFDAVDLLRRRGVIGSDEDLQNAVRDFSNHALSLNLLANWLFTHFHGDVSARHHITSQQLFAESEFGERARFVMAAYETRFAKGGSRHLELTILKLVGLFDRPAPGLALETLFEAPAIKGLTDQYVAMSVQERAQNYRIALRRLRTLDLISAANPHQKDDVDAHPLVRAYFGKQLKDGNPGAWREAHERLSKYYSQLMPQKPRKAHELDVVFYALYHCCKGGQPKFAYEEYLKILRNARGVSNERLLDHSSLVSAYFQFFEHPWSTPLETLDEKMKIGVLKGASFSLKASGQLDGALQALEGVLVRLEGSAKNDFEARAIISRRAAEICITLGRLASAETFAKEAVRFADLTRRHNIRSATRATLADALHQRGELDAARPLFQSATDIYRAATSPGKWITAESGYKFSEYLFTAGRKADLKKLQIQMADEMGNKRAPEIFRAYYHLVSALSLLANDPAEQAPSYGHVQQASDSFRNVEAMEYVARSLWLAATLSRKRNDYTSARRELDEAMYLSATYGFRLIYTDCLLERVELLINQPKEMIHTRLVEAYKMAQTLIWEMGYGKRLTDMNALGELVLNPQNG